MFLEYQYNSEYLPPMFGALKHKIFCSHYVTLTLKHAAVSKQNLSSFLNSGWEIVWNTIMPILTDNLLAPLALIELSACSCKTGCKTNAGKVDLHVQTRVNVHNVKTMSFLNYFIYPWN